MKKIHKTILIVISVAVMIGIIVTEVVIYGMLYGRTRGIAEEYSGEYKIYKNKCVVNEKDFFQGATILTYDEYINHFNDVILSETYYKRDDSTGRYYEVGLTKEEKALKLKEAYSDENVRYIVLSYGTSYSDIDFKFYDVDYNNLNEEITLHVFLQESGCMAEGEGYLLVIPTNCSENYKINVVNYNSFIDELFHFADFMMSCER